ncbi:MAG: transcription termination/antitermination protein NusG, partial [Rhizomicrobium sp.]
MAGETKTGLRWYAVHCRPHREGTAALHLANQHFTTFLPCRDALRRHARRIEKVRRPFFPGYLFIRLDTGRDRWRSINGTVGVVRLVMNDDHPTPAPEGIVETLIAACDGDGNLGWNSEFKVGQKVRVISGPLTDLVGELEQLTDTQRVRVLLDIMGGRTRVRIPR